MAFKSGFVTIVGRPNVGKSTLINRFTGEKIAITSNKPQTTRNTIKAVITKSDSQVIFIDTPGIHKPKNKLGEYMVNIAESTLKEVDAVLFMVEATETAPGAGDLYIIEQMKELKTPVILAINKVDLVSREKVLPVIAAYSNLMKFSAVVPISALSDDGIDILLKEIRQLLPEGPKFFPEDIFTDQPEKTLAAEIIREKILHLVSDEVPHGVGIEVLRFKERDNKDMIDILANIYCEKETHKGILIGREGKMLKRIGSLAREEIENLLGTKVFLELWVKVKPDWRNSQEMLKTLGYK